MEEYIERLCRTHYVCEMSIDGINPLVVSIPRKSASKTEAKEMFLEEAKRTKVKENAKFVKLRMHW